MGFDFPSRLESVYGDSARAFCDSGFAVHYAKHTQRAGYLGFTRFKSQYRCDCRESSRWVWYNIKDVLGGSKGWQWFIVKGTFAWWAAMLHQRCTQSDALSMRRYAIWYMRCVYVLFAVLTGDGWVFGCAWARNMLFAALFQLWNIFFGMRRQILQVISIIHFMLSVGLYTYSN